MAHWPKNRLDSVSDLCILTFIMKRGTQPTANQTRRAKLERAMAEILAETLRRGFHGTASLELAVQDGTIQHIRRRIERIEK